MLLLIEMGENYLASSFIMILYKNTGRDFLDFRKIPSLIVK